MPWLDQYTAKQVGAQQAQANDIGAIGGFVSSAVSAIPEMFGANPFPSAEAFREEHPVAGVVSELAGGLVPYAGWEGIVAKVPSIARGLEAATALTRLDPLAQPIRYGAAKLAIKFAPVELARLGTGLFTTDDWDKYKGLMADVGLSTLLTGGIGGIGGFLKSGGTLEKALKGRIADAPLGLAAPFELRLSNAPDAQVIGNAPLGEVQQNLMKETFQERPLRGSTGSAPVRAPAVTGLEGVEEPKAAVQLSSLFNESKGDNPQGLIRKRLMDNAGNWTLGEDGNNQLLGGLGMDNMQQLAESGRFPTVVTVGSARAAGTMRRALGGLSPVADGVFMGREAGDGLFVLAKRLRSGAADALDAARARATAAQDKLKETLGTETVDASKDLAKDKIEEGLGIGAEAEAASRLPRIGDQWFVVKTDQPQRFVPDVAKAADVTFSQFSKYVEPYDAGRVGPDFFNDKQNLMLQTMTPQDFKDVLTGKLPKEAFRATVGKRIMQQLGDATGISESETLNRIADKLYDVTVPTMFKEQHNPLFGRLFSMLRLNMSESTGLVNSMIGGAVRNAGKVFGKAVTHDPMAFPGVPSLTHLLETVKPSEEDLQTVFHVGMAQAPKDALADLTKDGLVTPKAQAMLDGLSAIDKGFWGEMLPVAQNVGQDGKFSLLQGPYVPRLYAGDTFVPVFAEDGKTMKFLASGNLAQAKHEAATFVEEAKQYGHNYSVGKPRGIHQDETLALHTAFEEQVLRDPQINTIATATAKKLAMENAGIRAGMLRGPVSKSLTAQRTGILGSPDRAEYTAKDLVNAVRSHYSQIARQLGYESWRQRWLPEVFRLRGNDETLFNDLNRRSKMLLGYEGPSAKFLNKALAPVFGPALGGKAASTIARGTNELLYMWNIALANPTFSIVNLLTPLQTVAPWISAMKTSPRAAEDMMHVHLRYGADGKPAGVFNNLSTAKVLGKALRELGNPDDELAAGLARAKTDGTLSPQLYEFAVGQHGVVPTSIRGSFENAGGGVAGTWAAIKNIATWTSRHSEEWSRMYGYTAAHIVGRDLFGLQGEALYRFAQKAVNTTMYGYHAADRSLMFTGPIGSMFGLFKNWQMHFIGQMMQYAGMGWRGESWAPLMWQFGGSLALGGIGATPAVLLADQIARWTSDQPNSWLWMKENWHGAADEIYYGFPALFGISLQASATLPGTDVRNDISTLANFAFVERAKAAWKATAGAWDYAEANGQNPLKNPNIRDALLQAYAPRALFRAFATTENNAIKSMSTGYPQVRDVSGAARLAYMVGLNPLEVEEAQTASNYLWDNQQAQRDAIQQMGARFAQAQLAGDSDEMERVVNSALVRGLPISSIAKSAQTRLRREQNSDLLSKYGPSAQVYRDALGS